MMDGWIFPSVMAALVSSLLLDVIYFYVWIEYRERHVLLWAQGWLFYSLRFCFTLAIVVNGPHPSLTAAELLSTVVSSLFLIEGAYVFCRRRISSWWRWLAVAAALWSLVTSSLGLPFIVISVPAYYFMGFALIFIGMVFFRFMELHKSKIVAGVPAILWGLHKFDYPFLRHVEWLAPWGFLLGAVCGVMMALGFLCVSLEQLSRLWKEGERRYRRIVEHAGDGIFLSHEGRIVDVNDVACRTLGYTREELLAMHVWDVDPTTSPEEHQTHWEDVQLEKVETYETTHIRKDGTPLTVETRLRRFEEGGKQYVLGLERDISERKRAEAELRAEVTRRQSLMEISYDGIAIFNQDHRIIEANKRFIENLGYTREELSALQTWDFEVLMSEEEIRNHFAEFSEFSTVFETKHRRKDGTIYDAEVSIGGAVIQDEPLLFTITRDITDRKRIEEALKASEQRFRSLLENIDMVAVRGYDKDCRIIYWNTASERLYGYSREEALGQRIEDISPPGPMSDQYIQFMKGWASRREALVPGEVDLIRKDGSLVSVYSSYVSQDNPEGDRELYCIDVELTEIKKAHDQLLKAKAAAEAANKAKSDFLANMSHEIRTPLNGIVGMLQLLNTTPQNGEQEEYTAHALASGKRLTGLLSDLLDVSAVEAGKLYLSLSPFNIHELVDSVSSLLELTATQKDVSLVNKVWPGVPEVVCGDELRLRQILFNLVGNGLKFTEAGHVTFDIYPLSRDGRPRGALLFIISDTGPGIPEDQFSLAFEAFGQISNGYRRTHQGAGLGLPIVKRLVDLMEGTICIESEMGRGTTFYVSIPLRDRETESAATESVPTGKEPGPKVFLETDGEPRAGILVVEDEQVAAMFMSGLLRKMGYGVSVAANGVEALQAFADERFDLVLMDIQMPVMDGVETTTAIRNGEAGPENVEIPIIAMTAYAMSGDRETFLDIGVDDYVAKPVDIELLQAVLERHLKKA